jgi:CheY-like chemotaxis protein
MSTSTILVVEDNDDDVFFMRRALKAAGCSADVRYLSDGKFALEYLRGQGEFADRAAHPLPVGVFLDLKMPLVSGLEVLAAVRREPALKGLQVYILTSSDEQRDRDSAAALAVEGYLVKPAQPATLAPILARLAASPAVQGAAPR